MSGVVYAFGGLTGRRDCSGTPTCRTCDEVVPIAGWKWLPIREATASDLVHVRAEDDVVR